MFSDINPYTAGRLTGQLVVYLLVLLGIGKCLSISRRPATNAPCVMSLALFLTVSLAGAVESVLAHFNLEPPLAGLMFLLLKLAIVAGSTVLSIVGLAQYAKASGRFTQGRGPGGLGHRFERACRHGDGGRFLQTTPTAPATFLRRGSHLYQF